MHQCKDCGWLLSPQSSSEPCPGCGGSNRLIISFDMGTAFEASSPPILLRSHRFAPEWFEDALSEARGPTLAIVPDNRNSKRREILFAVCCVEAYLIEWVYEDVLCEDSKKLLTYFPNIDRSGITERLKVVTKKLHEDGLLGTRPDFGGLVDWTNLVNYRNGLVHANASRPETATPGEPAPAPSLDDLDKMPKGWAVQVIIRVIRRLHSAAGTPPPAWLVKP